MSFCWYHFYEKLSRQQKIDRKEEKERRLTGGGEIQEEEEEGVFEGGLRVPAKLWTKLFKWVTLKKNKTTRKEQQAFIFKGENK